MPDPLVEANAQTAPPPAPIDRAAFFRDHSGLVLTASYLALIVVGMMYEFWLFWRFRINILYYAEAADFLLVPFREPLVILAATLPIVVFRFYMRGARWLGMKLSKPGGRQLSAAQAAFTRKFLVGVNILAMVLWSLAATAEFASYVARSIREGKRREVLVMLVSTPDPIRGTVIGTTSQWLFVYDPKIDQTRIIPVEQTAQILVERKKPRRPPR